MRKLIAGMKISVDGMMEGADGTADWVEAWSDDYGVMSEVDACLLGAGMYPGYERYWSAIQADPHTPVWITGQPPTPAEQYQALFRESQNAPDDLAKAQSDAERQAAGGASRRRCAG